MADELQPACNVPQLFVWPQHLARQQQHLDTGMIPQSPDDSLNDEASESTSTISLASELDDKVKDSVSVESRDVAKQLPFSLALIEEVRQYPCVWNVSSNSYKDKPKKMEAWRRISAALNQPGKSR